jgi:DNA-binding transcriptional LysR family regulator
MIPDFNRLKVFYYIFNEQSSTAAAKRLHITQSGVSQHLKKLEEEMQAPLFTRVKRRLVPTSAGTRLYGIVKNFMVDLEEGVRNIHETIEKPSGLLRMGAPTEFGRTYIPGIFASFHKQFPDVSLHLELADPTVLFSMVSEGKLDFAYIDILPIFTDTPGGDSAYTIEPVLGEEFVLACSRIYYEREIESLNIQGLVNQKYIAYKSDLALFHSWFRLHYDWVPQSLHVSFTVDSSQGIITAVEENLGLGITVSHMIKDQIDDGSIVPIRVTEKKLKNTIACVRFRDKVQTMTEAAFQKHLQSELKKI